MRTNERVNEHEAKTEIKIDGSRYISAVGDVASFRLQLSTRLFYWIRGCDRMAQIRLVMAHAQCLHFTFKSHIKRKVCIGSPISVFVTKSENQRPSEWESALCAVHITRMRLCLCDCVSLEFTHSTRFQ